MNVALVTAEPVNNQAQVPQGTMIQGVPPPAVTEREARMHERVNRLKVAQVLQVLAERDSKFRTLLSMPRARRIAWMERGFGRGALGCRHGAFMNGRDVRIIRRKMIPIAVGTVTCNDFVKAQISDSSRDDRWFECGQVFGDVPVLFEAFVHFLFACVHTGPFVRTPTDVDMRANFHHFWDALRTCLKIRKSDIEVPDWMCQPGANDVPPGIEIFTGETWNGITVEHQLSRRCL